MKETAAQSRPDRQNPATPVTAGAPLQHLTSLPQVSDHELLRLIGHGSYGEVWLARNRLGTLRAIKIVRRAAFDDARPFEREFKGIQKFEPISRSHEGLVDILQVGGGEEYFYYVMELADDGAVSSFEFDVSSSQTPADGQQHGTRNSEPGTYVPRTLRSDLKRLGHLPVTECVRIGLSLASALAHLHQQRLVHRDIKPSNIIFVEGAPKLADIGLVADLGEAHSFVGTQGFIAPEGPGTPQADLYSLGKVLYELSTGKDRHDFPELPENLRDLPDQEALIEFNAVLVKACAGDPRQRYQTAEELHADLALLQRGESMKRKRAVEWRLGVAKQIAAMAAIAIGAAIIVHFSLKTFVSRGKANRPESLLSGQIDKKGTANQAAYDAYSMGRFYFSKRTPDRLKKARAYFNQSIQLDSDFALAYAGLLDSYVWGSDVQECLPDINRVAEKILALDDTFAEGHTGLAIFRFCHWQWSEAEKRFRRALELNDHYAAAHTWYGLQLTCQRRFVEARRELDRAEQLEPTGFEIKMSSGLCFFTARQFDQAIARFEATIEMERDFPHPYWWLARAHEAKGEFLQASSALEKFDVLTGGESTNVAQKYEALRVVAKDFGAERYWKARLEQEKDSSYWTAAAYAQLGVKQEALDNLERAADEQPVQLVYLNHPYWDTLREEPRFKALLKRVGLER